MNRDDIIRMAVEAGFLTNELGSYLISPYTFEDQDLFDEFERFAELVAATEREACAALCFQMWNDSLDRRKLNHPDAEDCAAAIRARGQE
jgi:hypothetical protein